MSKLNLYKADFKLLKKIKNCITPHYIENGWYYKQIPIVPLSSMKLCFMCVDNTVITFMFAYFENDATAKKKEIKQIMKVKTHLKKYIGAIFQTDAVQLIMNYIKIYKKTLFIIAETKDKKIDTSQK